MTSNKKRRLAAIMFADIVGYTAMMQRNESEGLAKVRRFQEVLEQQVKAHEGEILQFLGDGCLCVFHSAVQSLKAAQAIQLDLKQWPEVPLRIGIHIGDIVVEGGSVYGDGVNLASRVESMGIPGSVLVTERVMNDLHSHPEFEMNSLGKFQFKNVMRPIEVYALASGGLEVPNPAEMKGKGEKVGAEIISPKSLIRLASIGFVAMVVGAILFWGLGTQHAGKTQLLSQDIREAKVAVGVFENHTGEEKFNALGFLASDWISSGLRELKVRTVAPEMVRQYKDAIGIVPDNPQKEASFAEITGADYVITGSFFLKDDSLILHTSLSSAITGDPVDAHFRQIVAHRDQKEELVKEARQYLLGYWVLKRDQQLPILNPPKYEAYQVYIGCTARQFDCYQKALEIDPEFTLARVWLMRCFGAFALDSLYNAEKNRLEKDWSRLTIYERNVFSYASSEYEGNYQAAFDALNANYQLDSMNRNVAHQSAYIASAFLNRTDIAIERYKHIFDNLHHSERLTPVLGHSYYHLCDAYNREGKYEKTIDLYLGLTEEKKRELRYSRIKQEVIKALIHYGRINEAQSFIQRLANSRLSYMRAAYIHAYFFPDSLTNPFVRKLSKQINDFPQFPASWRSIGVTNMRYWDSRFLLYYIQKDWDKAELELRKLDAYNWENYYRLFPFQREAWKRHEQLWLAAAWASIYAHQGKLDSCYKKIQELEVAGKLYNDDTHMHYLRGATAYLKARIYAILGEREKAVEALTLSIEQGRMYFAGNITLDIDFVNLKGYPPFEELIRPKNP